MKMSTRCLRRFSRIDTWTAFLLGEQIILGRSDRGQLAFATGQGRAILTIDVKDFVQLAGEFSASGKHHARIIVSDHLPFRELLLRVLRLLRHNVKEDLSDKLLWL